jgi:sulfoxide reductase heme-binding subunit YedZ
VIGVHFFWITSRAAGVVALLASSLAVSLGLMMGGRFGKGRKPDLRVAHEALSLATIAALVVHALALLGDAYMSPSLADISIPFVSGYQRLWTTTGIVAGWMLIVLGLSYYVRGRIGPARWRSLHRFTALAWVLGVIHSVGEGTDASAAWFLAAAAAVVLPASALLVARMTPAEA